MALQWFDSGQGGITFDKVRFSVICKSWVTAVKEQRCMKPKALEFPCCWFPAKTMNKARSLYNITERKIYDLYLSMPYNRRCCGSSFSWLSIVTNILYITLLNSFRNPKTHFPHLQKLRSHKRYANQYQYLVQKVTLSSDPAFTPEDYFVVALYAGFNNLA